MVDCIRSTGRPVLVLLPGMMCDQRLWRAQVECFSADYELVIGDISGADSISEIATRILSTLPPSFSLAGLSMGGIIALEMWRQAPERIQRLALLDTNHQADAPEKFSIRNQQMEQVALGGLLEVMREELKPNYLAQCHKHSKIYLSISLNVSFAQLCL